MNNSVSIIICTRNRAEALTQTLVAMQQVCVPDTWQVELIIVDNASTDDTPVVVQNCWLPAIHVRYVLEERPGKALALNTGLKAARGRVALFTDDDVRPPHNWLVNMAEPILTGKVAAMAGGVHIAPHLRRSWMHPLALAWFASTEGIADSSFATMLGANCAFARVVLSKVPGYDVELGPGRLGFMEDVLFSWQLHQAGYKMGSAMNTAVEHHFEPNRMARASLIDRAMREGHSQAYFDYHVLHGYSRFPRLRLWQWQGRLLATRLIRWRDCRAQEGMQAWEMHLLDRVGFWQQYLQECRRPRNYEKHGLVKLAGEQYAASPEKITD